MRKPSLLFLAALGALGWSGLSAQASSPLRVAQLSDIHDGGTHYSEPDTAIAVTDALREDPDGVVLTGDFNDNSHDQSAFYDRLHAGLPKVLERLKSFQGPLFLALGNDDFSLNYQSGTEELGQTTREFKADFGERFYLDELGDGVSPNRLGGITWVTINSVVFNPRNKFKEADRQASEVLTFLEQKLAAEAAARTPIALLMHVPPTIDYFNNQPSWKPEYIQRLLSILRGYPGQMVILAAHYHRNQVYRIERKQGDVPIFTVGALASKYGYAPNWRSYAWHMADNGKKFAEIDYTLHYPRHPEWTSNYQIFPDHLKNFLEDILHDGPKTIHYIKDIFGHHGDPEAQAKDRDERRRLREEFDL